MAKLKDWIAELPCRLLCGNTDEEVTELVYDSRKAGPGTVFVCMAGSKTDSHRFIPQVLSAGCRVLVVERDLASLCAEGLLEPANCAGSAEETKDGKALEMNSDAGLSKKTDADADFGGKKRGLTVLLSKNGRQALALLSAARFGYPARRMKLIGLTGTKGKTTVSYMLRTLLEGCGERVGVIGTNGCEIAGIHYETKNTTPESYEIHERLRQMADAGCRYAVMECSSQGFKMHRTDGIIFDYGLFLNISPDHIGPLEHADFAEYLDCKKKIFGQSGIGILNADDAHAVEILSENAGRKGFSMFTYGISDGAAGGAHRDLSAADIRYIADGKFVGTAFCTRGLLEGAFRLSLPGLFNVSNALAALTVCSLLKLPEEKLKEALLHIHVDGRMEIVYHTDRFQILVDYAHNEVSMESLLDTLRSYRPKRLVVVFGCGGNRAKDRRTGMGAAAARAADLTILTADNSRFEKTEDIIADIRAAYLSAGGSRERLLEIPDRREAIRRAVQQAEDGDMIAVIGKGHETYQEADGVRTHFSDREEILAALDDESAEGR